MKKILLIAVVVLCIGVVGFNVVDRVAKEESESIVLENINTSIADGEYEGSYKMSPVDVSLIVKIKDEKIIDVDILKHINGLGNKGENIVESVIDKQSTDVDVVSGATLSSKVILKAIENALEEGNN